MSTNNYKAAFEALSLDLSTIIALLGFDSYTGVDPVLRRITELLVSVPQNPDPRGVTATSHPALISLDKQCRDDVARAMGLTPTAERDFAWSYLLDRLKRLVGGAAKAGSDGGVDELLADALRKIMAAHRFNVASMPVTEVHSICFDALAASSPKHPRQKAQPSGVVLPNRRVELKQSRLPLVAAEIKGWNKCLDKVARLNSGPACAGDERIDIAQMLADAERNERHANNAETRYWCRQYKQLARAALAAPAPTQQGAAE